MWAQEPTILRNNYMHGVKHYRGGYRQGLDLDDGSSNYHLYNNVCVGMALSIREGDHRTVENNIIIDPVVPVGIHCGCSYNSDVIRRNIICTTGELYHMNDVPNPQPYVQELNHNLFYSPKKIWGHVHTINIRPRGERLKKYTLPEWQELGYDKDSIVADPEFVDLENEDYRVKSTSPALELGFKNFDMNWGLTEEFPDMWRE